MPQPSAGTVDVSADPNAAAAAAAAAAEQVAEHLVDTKPDSDHQRGQQEGGDSPPYRVLHCATHDVLEPDGANTRLTFCVRWWPPRGDEAECFELSVKCKLETWASSGSVSTKACGTPEAARSLCRPRLLWDDTDSVAFEWHQPRLPASNGCQEIDRDRQCIISHLTPRAGGRAWHVRLEWRCHSWHGRTTVPKGVWAALQLHDGRRVHSSGSGGTSGCFEIPLRREIELEGGRPDWPVLRQHGGETCQRLGDTELLQAMRSESAGLRLQLRQADTRFEEAQRRHQQLVQQLRQLPRPEVIVDLRARILGEVTHRRVLQEELMHRRGRIRVFGRIRGLRPDEVAYPEQCAVVRLSQTEVSLPLARRSFEFDLVFGPETRTAGIWDEVWPLVDSVFDQPGMHACVMAYGQTGAGKTFTMEGSDEQPGLIVRTAEHLFSRAADASSIPEEGEASGDKQQAGIQPRVDISVSMIEIYQEQLYDLLNPSSIDGGRLLLRNDGCEAGPEVRGLHIASPRTREEALALYRAGTKLRRQGASERNTRSSRSHTVFSLYIRRRSAGDEVLPTSKISFVDLAGSERQSNASGYDRERVTEACSINQSLTTLGKVVQACMARSCGRRPDRDRAHVPYRESLLTRLLSDSIGGQAKTLLIVHVTPHIEDAQESCCTLQFAANAACVQERAACWGGEEWCRREAGRLSSDNAWLRSEIHNLEAVARRRPDETSQQSGDAVQAALDSPSGGNLWCTPTPCRSRQQTVSAPSPVRGSTGVAVHS
mmetsp:Transcript_39288/g.77775  ORF Transcript_39288/g.77775 Transcript_39288/m.77775 type:complete len:770 (+) Transcript_39288:44-2353(+)